MRRFVSIAVLSLLISAAGCAKLTPNKQVQDPSEFEENVGIETMALNTKSLSFNTKSAIALREQDKSKEIKKRIQTGYSGIKVPDPWVPPEPVESEALTRALRYLPKDKFGYPHWTEAVQQGLIKPRWTLKPDTELEAGEYQLDYFKWLNTDKVSNKPAPAAPPADAKDAKADIKTDAKEKPREATLAEIKEKVINGPLDMDILFEINDRLMFNVVFPHKIHSFWLSCSICHPKIFIAKKGANQFSMYDIWNGEYCGRCHGKVAYQPKGYENCQRCHMSRKKTMGVR